MENEHFIVWMRTAGLPTFRKLYGKIHEDFKEDDILRFQVCKDRVRVSYNRVYTLDICYITLLFTICGPTLPPSCDAVSGSGQL